MGNQHSNSKHSSNGYSNNMKKMGLNDELELKNYHVKDEPTAASLSQLGKNLFNGVLDNKYHEKLQTMGGTAGVKVRTKWSPIQDESLRRAVEKYGEKDWLAIAKEVPGRSHIQCLQRWKKNLKPGLKKGRWSPEEDELLKMYVERNPEHNWAFIATKIQGRTDKQCRERWKLNLDPSINRSAWTPDEDAKLLQLHDRYGNRWSEISTHLQGRTENAVKTRYNSLQRAKQKRWSFNEDKTLIESRILRNNRWVTIAEMLRGRSKHVVKRRWLYLVQKYPELLDAFEFYQEKRKDNPKFVPQGVNFDLVLHREHEPYVARVPRNNIPTSTNRVATMYNTRKAAAASASRNARTTNSTMPKVAPSAVPGNATNNFVSSTGMYYPKVEEAIKPGKATTLYDPMLSQGGMQYPGWNAVVNDSKDLENDATMGYSNISLPQLNLTRGMSLDSNLGLWNSANSLKSIGAVDVGKTNRMTKKNSSTNSDDSLIIRMFDSWSKNPDTANIYSSGNSLPRVNSIRNQEKTGTSLDVDNIEEYNSEKFLSGLLGDILTDDNTKDSRSSISKLKEFENSYLVV